MICERTMKTIQLPCTLLISHGVDLNHWEKLTNKLY